MRYFCRVVWISLMLLSATACNNTHRVVGNGSVVVKTRAAAAFDQIAVAGNFQINAQLSNTQSIQVAADSNLQPLIVTRVKNNVLFIRNLHGYDFSSAKPIVINIAATQLKSVYVMGESRASVNGLTGDTFVMNVTGMAKVTLAGKVKNVELHVTGSSEVNASQLYAENVEININGMGVASVFASNQLKAHISGMGQIHYSGSPKTKLQSITGEGKIDSQ